MFVQQAFQRKLVAASFRNMSGQMGYAPNHNAFNVFGTDDNSSVDTAATKEAPNAGTAGTTRSTLGTMLGSTYQASTVPTELAAAIQTIAANQHALYQHVAPFSQQMAAMAFQTGPPTMGNASVPQVPTYVGYQGGGYTGGYVEIPAGTRVDFNRVAAVDAVEDAVMEEVVQNDKIGAALLLRIMSPMVGDSEIPRNQF